MLRALRPEQNRQEMQGYRAPSKFDGARSIGIKHNTVEGAYAAVRRLQ